MEKLLLYLLEFIIISDKRKCCLYKYVFNKYFVILLLFGSHFSIIKSVNIYPDTISFVLKYNKILLPVNVNGVDRVFFLDTGASQTVLSNTNQNVFLTKKKSRDANGLDIEFYTEKMDSIKIGHSTFRDKEVLLYNFQQSGLACLGIDGVLVEICLKM